MINAWPDAAKSRGSDPAASSVGRDSRPTPLLLAVARDAPDAVVITMLAKCPASARVKDHHRRTALHYTMSGPTTDAFASAVFNAWPEAALEATYPILPHECALKSMGNRGVSETVLCRIFATFPDLARRENAKKTLPLHVAAQSR